MVSCLPNKHILRHFDCDIGRGMLLKRQKYAYGDVISRHLRTLLPMTSAYQNRE